MASQRFYRIVGKNRSGNEALTSSAGRFHDDSSNPTSYVARTLETAWSEVSANLGPVRANPDAFRALEIIVDEPEFESLEDRPAFSSLMRDPAPPEGRELAEDLRAMGSDGLMYPSMRHPGGECVVLFLENVRDRVQIRSVSDEEWSEFSESVC